MAYSVSSLRPEYESLFETCVIKPSKLSAVKRIVQTIIKNRSRYEGVGNPLDIPWFVIGCVHNLESSLKFNGHLHNGDPLTARTFNEPKGRPPKGKPPFTWEESANDALVSQGWHNWRDWSLAGCLYKFEAYNGFGYRQRQVPSPYLWSYSNHYVKGKYVHDGPSGWDPNAVSQQCGTALILSQLVSLGEIDLEERPSLSKNDALQLIKTLGKVVQYSTAWSQDAEQLQEALVASGAENVDVDGYAGKKTSDAYKQISGSYLKGDPRSSKS
jgi:lysozyme family protein